MEAICARRAIAHVTAAFPGSKMIDIIQIEHCVKISLVREGLIPNQMVQCYMSVD